MNTSSREPYRPVLATDADVTTMWRTVISPLGWHDARVYVLLVDGDRRPTSVIVEIDEIPDRFTEEDAHALMQVYAHLLGDHADEHAGEHADGGSVAVLVCRPGPPHLTDDDRECCRHLYAAGRAADVPLELLHLGTDTAIVPVPMDEVLPRTA